MGACFRWICLSGFKGVKSAWGPSFGTWCRTVLSLEQLTKLPSWPALFSMTPSQTHFHLTQVWSFGGVSASDLHVCCPASQFLVCQLCWKFLHHGNDPALLNVVAAQFVLLLVVYLFYKIAIRTWSSLVDCWRSWFGEPAAAISPLLGATASWPRLKHTARLPQWWLLWVCADWLFPPTGFSKVSWALLVAAVCHTVAWGWFVLLPSSWSVSSGAVATWTQLMAGHWSPFCI